MTTVQVTPTHINVANPMPTHKLMVKTYWARKRGAPHTEGVFSYLFAVAAFSYHMVSMVCTTSLFCLQ